MRALYLATLFVHSNSNLHAIKNVFPEGSLSMQPTPILSFVLEPSKCEDH